MCVHHKQIHTCTHAHTNSKHLKEDARPWPWYFKLCVYLWVCAHECSANGGQKKAWEPLNLKLQIMGN